MVSWNAFLASVTSPTGLGRSIQQDPGQLATVQAPLSESLHIIAGPGTGKTTALTLRILKLTMVDGVDPGAVLATTFTKKAANELRSRILGWGDRLKNHLLATNPADRAGSDWLRTLDYNRVITGTLDSIAEQVLTENRAPGTQPPIVLEDFVSRILLQRSLWDNGRFRDADLLAYARALDNQNRTINGRDLLNIAREVRDRLVHDQVDVPLYVTSVAPTWPGVTVLTSIIADYDAELTQRLTVDFVGLEARFLASLIQGTVSRFQNRLRVVLVDEYQDTNLLQEQIYLALASCAAQRNGSITVVGDDDQALFRFRGATVELFVNFPARAQQQTGIRVLPVPLTHNYRSTPTLVTFFSDFVTTDVAYTPARVPNKPRLVSSRRGQFTNYPVLGMFRRTVGELAQDLVQFLDTVFNGTGHLVTWNGNNTVVLRDPNAGRVGDCALLCSSPAELSSSQFGTPARPRLPLLLRQGLGTLQTPIAVFNPRGRDLCDVPAVAELCGLVLSCIDPQSAVQNANRIPQSVVTTLNRWRVAGAGVIASNPPAPGTRMQGGTLGAFVSAWQARRPQRQGTTWPQEISLLQLVYDLISWFPVFQDDPEGLVYLEAISRTITETAPLLSYEATIHRDAPHADRSIRQAIWSILVPLASGIIEVNEDLMEQLPNDRLNVLSIHQAKGLEFPLTIVDIGSDFRTRHHSQAFRRFPSRGTRAHNLEDQLRPYSPGFGVPQRSAVDRAFDDLVRQYFVAFSRPQDALLLVGIGEPATGPSTAIPNIAAGFCRDGSWPWAGFQRMALI